MKHETGIRDRGAHAVRRRLHPSAGRPVRTRQREVARQCRVPRRSGDHRRVRRSLPVGRGRARRDPARGQRGFRDGSRCRAAASARRSATCSPASWTRIASRRSATRRWRPTSRRLPTSRISGGWPHFSAGSNERTWAASRVLRATPTTGVPTGTSSTSGRAGSACPTSRTTATTRSPSTARSTWPTWPRCCDCSVDRRRKPSDAAERLMALETRLAASHWDRVRCRDVLATYNLTTLDELRAAAPAFDWPAWIGAMGGTEDQFAEVLVRQPSYLPAISEALTEIPLDDWKIWLTFHLVRRAAPYLSRAFVDENFEFYLRTLTGAEAQRDRWKRGVRPLQPSHRRSGRRGVRRPRAAARGEGRDGGAGRQSAGGVSGQHRPARLDERRDARTCAGEAGPVPTRRSATRLRWRDYSALEIARDDLVGNVRRAAAFEADRQLGKLGAPSRPRRVVHDPADRQRLLQPGRQRDLLPRRHPAATVLPGRRRPGAQLRRDRRGDRPRDRPRLRRPGLAVRRRRQPRELVDRRRSRPVQGACRQADRPVRRLRAPDDARPSRQRRPDGRREHRRSRRAHHRPAGVRDQPPTARSPP